MAAEPEPPKGAEDRETSRVEAFSDGVMAVIITIMAFELKARLAFLSPYIAYGIFAAVAIIWFVPDRRFSRR